MVGPLMMVAGSESLLKTEKEVILESLETWLRWPKAGSAQTPAAGLRSPRVAMQFSAVCMGVQLVHPRKVHSAACVDRGSVCGGRSERAKGGAAGHVLAGGASKRVVSGPWRVVSAERCAVSGVR